MTHTLWFILYDSVNKWLLSVVSFTWYGNYAFTDLHKLLIDSLNLIFLNFLLNIWIFVKRNILLYNRRTICNSENRHINFPMWISRISWQSVNNKSNCVESQTSSCFVMLKKLKMMTKNLTSFSPWVICWLGTMELCEILVLHS